ncbi:hypothetical protein O0882_00390 [Janthinobacterium sp. SUN073]|uniref:DUF7710 domain-containing protein n=1 Tax=Janthinobacterium sp. SUN073 TaxID=3004102 RepID=UPI0025B0D983|nr:hypothetical protein [Janthinobacterium sp. SUN073]MDN2694766.1 hypothetical protein [Janthinobacterium sp. SUN073]
MNEVWIFSGSGGKFASGVFSDKDQAILWIESKKLTGVLTKYPVNFGMYDWAIKNDFFTPMKEHEFTPEFEQRFTCASQEHYHFEDGIRG